VLEITGPDIRRLVPMDAAITATRRAFEMAAAGEFDQPTRIGLRDGRCLVMLASAFGQPGVVVKAVSIAPGNVSRGLPTISSTVLWMDDSTGQVSALIDGTALTSLRTGAASGVATDLLSDREARVLAMIGAGAQAPDQIAAVCAVRPIREVRIWSRSADSRLTLTERIRRTHPGVHVRSEQEVRDAVAGADVICTATRSTEPVIWASDVAPNAHINAIGAYRPTMVELAPDVLARATTVVIDDREAAMSEAGDILQAIDAGLAITTRLQLLGALAADRVWRRPAGISVFKSVGIAAQDWAIARLAFERAMVDGHRVVSADEAIA
jgi:ornithine cyclodeaminase/alanine dehydrogenase-like protein (mu-crystallin family)